MRFVILLAKLITLKGISDLDIRISNLCYINSTKPYVRIYKQIMQNKPNFPYFSPENEDYAKKQSQYKPKQTQSVFCFLSSVICFFRAKPIQTQILSSIGAYLLFCREQTQLPGEKERERQKKLALETKTEI